MTPVRACVVLLALLPACLDFPEGKSYTCSPETVSTDCPGGWVCLAQRCLPVHTAACRVACEQFYGCGAADVCQQDDTCTVRFLHVRDADACTASCTANAEGFTDSQLICVGELSCAEQYTACLG